MEILRGDIWLVDLGKTMGSEQSGVRYCLVVQNDMGNLHAPTTIISPITTQPKKFNKTHLQITNTGEVAWVLCEQIKTISKLRLKHKLCRLSDSQMKEIDRLLMSTLGIVI